MRILMIFIDGIGIGYNDTSRNPFAALPSTVFTDFLDRPRTACIGGGVATRADASLNVEGLPQSATGQTALLTGVNAARAIGRHLNGFPTSRLKGILRDHSILKALTDSGRKATFINVFNPLFFEAMEQNQPIHASVTTVANMAASLPFFGIEDLIARRAVYQDFTNKLLIEKGFDVPVFTPAEAGAILAQSAGAYDFCLYEYFQSDVVAHTQSRRRAIEEVKKLDEFLLTVLENTDQSEVSIIIASDHGNLEDLTVRTHTANPVPVLLWGEAAAEADTIHSILDITPTVLKLLLPA
jgi:hypothetical protein